MPIFQSQFSPLSKSSSAKLIFKKYWFYSLPIILLLVTIGLGLYLKSSQDSRRSADNNNQLAGYVYFDRNNNNQRDASAEAGPWLAAVVLYNQAGQEVKRTYTNQQGFFKFINVDNAQTYKLRAEHPKNHDGSQNSSTYYVSLPSYYVENASAGYSYNIKVTEGDVWYFDLRPELIWPQGATALPAMRPDPGIYTSRSNWNMNDNYTGMASGVPFCDASSVKSVGYNFGIRTNAPAGKQFCGDVNDSYDQCRGSCFSTIGWLNSVSGGSQVSWESWHSFPWKDVASVSSAAAIADWHNYYGSLNNVIKQYLQNLAPGKKAYVGILLVGGDHRSECLDFTPSEIKKAVGTKTVACGQVPTYSIEWTQYYAHFVRELNEWAWDDSAQGLGAELRSKLAGWVVPTGIYGETITGDGVLVGDFDNFTHGWHTYSGLHWLNYGTSNSDLGSYGRIVPNSNPVAWYYGGTGWDVGFIPNPSGSAASVMAIWDRWSQKPIHIFNTAVKSSFYISEFAKAAYFYSNRGPIGMRQHGWAWTVPTHHAGSGDKFKTDAFGQVDIWKNSYMEMVSPGGSTNKIWNSSGESQSVPQYTAANGVRFRTGYLPFAVSGVEHFYAGNVPQTYKSWLWLAANGIQNQDTSPINYTILGQYVDNHPRITWADSFWAWINKMYQLDSEWVATLRFFQIGSVMQRAENIFATITWRNNSQGGVRGAENDWVKQVSDAYEYDMAITAGINLINRCSNKGGTSGDVADACFTAAPAHLSDASSPDNVIFGIGSFAEINFSSTQNIVEFKPFAYPERVPEWKLKTGDSVAVYLVMANFKHNLKIYYGREGAWGQPYDFNSISADRGWQIYQFSSTYHPDNVIRIEANSSNGSSYKDYIHLAIFQEQWSEDNPAAPLPTGVQTDPTIFPTNPPNPSNPANNPTPTISGVPQATPVPRTCNQFCNDVSAPCASPMVCTRETSGRYESHCRLPNCLDDANCSCATVPTNVPIIPTATDVPTVPTIPAATDVPTIPTVPAATDVPTVPTIPASTQPPVLVSNTFTPTEPDIAADTTRVLLSMKLDGVPLCEEAGCFALTSAGDNISVQVTLQNTFDIPITQKTLFSFDAANKTYVSAGPLTYKNLTPGPYFIILKGPKQLATRYCYYDTTATQSCLVSDLINMTLNFTKDQAMVKKFIYLEPGMNYRLDLSSPPMIAGDLPISGPNKNEQDGKVDTIDYSFILGCLKNQTEASCVQRGDINFTGEVNNIDLMLLRQALMQVADQL